MTKQTIFIHLDKYTGPAAVTDLYPFGDMDLGYGAPWGITKITGIYESRRQVSTADLAAAPGAVVTGEHIKARNIHIEASYNKRDGLDTWQQRAVLNSALNQTGKMRMTLTTTVHGNTDTDVTTYIDFYIDGWALKDAKNLDVKASFTIDMICPDPFFRDTEFQPEPAATLSARRARSRKAVVMGGDVPGPFRALITASGDVVRPRVTDDATGKWLDVDATLHAGTELHVSTDPAERTVRIDGDYDGRPYMSRGSDAFLVAPGGSVSFSAESGEENMTADVAYQARFTSPFIVSRET